MPHAPLCSGIYLMLASPPGEASAFMGVGSVMARHGRPSPKHLALDLAERNQHLADRDAELLDFRAIEHRVFIDLVKQVGE